MSSWQPYSAHCPSRQALDRIGDKWSVLVLCLLGRETLRFNELKRRIEGVSQKMLSQTLKGLERDGLIGRTAYPTVPVTVEYAITPLGRTLNQTLDAMRVWAIEHMDEVVAAQQAYDAAQRGDGARRGGEAIAAAQSRFQ